MAYDAYDLAKKFIEEFGDELAKKLTSDVHCITESYLYYQDYINTVSLAVIMYDGKGFSEQSNEILTRLNKL